VNGTSIGDVDGAFGDDLLLNPSSNNVTSTAYTLFSVSFSVASPQTKYIAFAMYTAGGGPCAGVAMYIDDITITYNTAFSPGTASASTTTPACAGTSTLTLTGYSPASAPIQ
jgi:hypothetical protein